MWTVSYPGGVMTVERIPLWCTMRLGLVVDHIEYHSASSNCYAFLGWIQQNGIWQGPPTGAYVASSLHPGATYTFNGNGDGNWSMGVQPAASVIGVSCTPSAKTGTSNGSGYCCGQTCSNSISTPSGREALEINGNRFWCGGASVMATGIGMSVLPGQVWPASEPSQPARIATPSALTTASPAGRSWRRVNEERGLCPAPLSCQPVRSPARSVRVTGRRTRSLL